MYKGRPVIGIAGGIGSGKTFISNLFGELGCFVIHADDQVRRAYEEPEIRLILENWWGRSIFKPDGSIHRAEIAWRIFSDPAERVRLEELIHARIAVDRDRQMAESANNPKIAAFIWDTPLLYEAGLDKECDAVVFVDAPEDMRRRRVKETRGWDNSEIIRRENLQWPLDKKQKMAHYVLVNTADAAASRGQVREILSRILAN